MKGTRRKKKCPEEQPLGFGCKTRCIHLLGGGVGSKKMTVALGEGHINTLGTRCLAS